MHTFGVVVLVILFSIIGIVSLLILWYAIDSMIEDSKTQKERTIAWEEYYQAERIRNEKYFEQCRKEGKSLCPMCRKEL